MKKLSGFLLIVFLCLTIVGCVTSTSTTSTTTTTTTTTTTSPGNPLSQYRLEYLVLNNYPDYFWCDPDFYPIGRPGIEEQNAIDQFPEIKSNSAEFDAILEELGLPLKSDYTSDEKLAIYREHKKLTYIVDMTASGSGYQFVIRVGENQGQRITGNISPTGEITETNREVSFNTCPICLAKGTLIDTPSGQFPVEDIKTGMEIWTQSNSGTRIAVNVLKSSRTGIDSGFKMIEITLADGRSIEASPGHPSAELKALGDYKVGEILDNATIIEIETNTYRDSYTYDVLPDGETGFYWANGILIASTLK